MITITAVRAATVRWVIPATGAAGRGAWPTRAAVVIELTTADGHHGLGEAAPLPGRSTDTLADAADAVAALAARLPVAIADVAAAAALAAAITAAPAARFAVETALLDALARAGGTTVADLLADRPGDPPATLELAVVVDDAAAATAAVAAGARILKVKVGDADDHRRLAAIRAAAPRARLRLDANRGWSAAEAVERLASLAALLGDALAFVEEPCADTAALLAARLPCEVALDEGLRDIEPDALARALRAPDLAALVLKPTLLGGLTACRALARAARRAGVAAIVTHALEGPIATAACAELARARGGADDALPGLAPHPGLAGWAISIPQLAARPITVGLGLVLDLDALLAAAPDAAPLSIRAAARTHGDQLALITATARWTFAELAGAAVASVAGPIIATPSRATIAAVHAALAARTPLALLHHRWPSADHDRARAALAATTLPDDAALVLFTSGSTAAPRGVVLPRLALVAAAAASAAHLGWRDDDRWLCALPLAHAGGLAVVVRCLIARRPIVLIEGDATAASLAAHLADHAVTLASLVPTQLAALLDDPAWRPPPALRAILLGGAAAPPALLAAAAARGVPVLTSYGMTETFGQVVTARLGDARRVHADVGVALPGITVTAGTAAAPAPIRVAGAVLAAGYLGEPPLDGALVTRDLGWLDDAGRLHVVGRVDDVIITGGENVHPLAIEAILVATPGVRAACAFGVPDPRWGERVAAALVVDPTFDLAAATTAWAAALPPHARPRELALVDALPLGPTGKVDRRAAAQRPRIAVATAAPSADRAPAS